MVRSEEFQDQQENSYLINAESATEMARLLDQDKFLTQVMGGIFPERNEAEMSDIARILDIGCGPGGWVHEVAHTYPTIEVVGIDISKTMIDYARAHARVRQLPNAEFHVMDALKPLNFPDESFDMVNMRTVNAFIPPQAWPSLLRESKRILRKGGVLRLTEWDSSGTFTNAAAPEKLLALYEQALRLAGRSFNTGTRQNGLYPALSPLLRQAGFRDIHHKAYAVDYSFGTPYYEENFLNWKIAIKLLEPFCLKMQVTTAEEFNTLYEQSLIEMQAEDFSGIFFCLTLWGEKP